MTDHDVFPQLRRLTSTEVGIDKQDEDSTSSSSEDSIFNTDRRNVRRRLEAQMNNATTVTNNTAGGSARVARPVNSNTLGGFVNTSTNAILSSAHATALTGILQLAGGHQDGIVGSLGHGNRTQWIRDNIHRLFETDGPLSGFTRVSEQVLRRHLFSAQQAARTYYRQDHSNDQSGARHEDIPEWA